MARSNSPRAAHRRSVLDTLAAAKRAVTYLQNRWQITSTVYVPHPDGPAKSGTYRDRHPDEYPEAKALNWGMTVTDLDALIADLQALRQEAYTHYLETLSERTAS